ncbi:hypothetical protein PR048_032762 [Dryococelus australis]|uniref:SPIN-DOC-like zinc-finger domain-containing protein n=1 Tax=Dryococelus australis TaxID=614101 RepID=A0ABQ9G345_9NEOP|nr:hypothetical protein PR048_032762 [Dryococelus australis]
MSNSIIKRKIGTENRVYQERWENNYLVANNKGKLQCLVCMQIVSVPKEYNVKRHYSTRQSRNVLIQDLKKKLKQQTGELLDLCSLHGATKGSDIYVAVKNSVDKFGGFGKCSAIVTDGEPAMETCGKSVKQDEVMKTVLRVVSMLRGRNRALVHRQFKQFLEELESEYGDLLLFCSQVGKEIPEFLSHFISSDTADLEKVLQSSDFLRKMAFLTDITGYLNELNLKLQGKDHFVSDLVGHINTIMAELSTRFQDFEGTKSSILLFNNPLGVVIQEQPANVHLELCDLQADAFLKKKPKHKRDLHSSKLISRHRFSHLCDFGSSLTDSILLNLLRLARTGIDVDIPALANASDRHQISH